MTANIPCNIKNFMALPLVLVHFHFYGIFVCVDCLHENIHRTREFHGYIEMHEAFSLRSCVCVSVWKCRWNVNDNKYFECEQIPWINTHKQWQVVCIQNGPLSNDISNWKLNFNTRKCAMVCVCMSVYFTIKIAREKLCILNLFIVRLPELSFCRSSQIFNLKKSILRKHNFVYLVVSSTFPFLHLFNFDDHISLTFFVFKILRELLRFLLLVER